MQPRNYCALARQATAAMLDEVLLVRALFQLAFVERSIGGDPFEALRTAVRLIDVRPGPEAALLYAELAVVLARLGQSPDAPLQRAESLAEFNRAIEVCILLAAAQCGVRVQANLAAAEPLAIDAGPVPFVERVRQSIAWIYALRGDGGFALATARRIEERLMRIESLSLLATRFAAQHWGAEALDEAANLVGEISDPAMRCCGAASLARAHYDRKEYSGHWLHSMHQDFGRISAPTDLARCAPIIALTLARHGAIGAALLMSGKLPSDLQGECQLAICQEVSASGTVRDTRRLAEWVLLPGYRDRALLAIVTSAARAVGGPRVSWPAGSLTGPWSEPGSEPPAYSLAAS